VLPKGDTLGRLLWLEASVDVAHWPFGDFQRCPLSRRRSRMSGHEERPN
jgi:hypothetical protein